MIRLKGEIITETDKAWLIKVVEDENSELTEKEVWIPKSSSRLDEIEVSISIPESLYRKKVEHLLNGESREVWAK